MRTTNTTPKNKSRIRSAYQLIRGRNINILFTEILKRFNSESFSFGLRRDLYKSFNAPSAKIQFQIRPLKIGDDSELFDQINPDIVDPRLILYQKGIIEANIPTCYVAVTTNSKSCYMQWLIGIEHNEQIQSHFKGSFPVLKELEALLEGAYTNPRYRGLGIMPEAMSRIAEKAHLINARWVITFVDVTNIPSLKGCKRAGFEPYLLRVDRWFMFCRTITFHPLSETMVKDIYENIDNNNDVKRVRKGLRPIFNHTAKSPKAAVEPF